MTDSGAQKNTENRHDPAFIRIAQAEFLYNDAIVTFLSSFVAALTVIPVFYNVADHSRLYGWLAAFTLVTLIRYLSARHYLHQPRDINRADRAIKAFMLGAFASGLLWGTSGLVFIPFTTLSDQQALLYISFYVMYCSALSAGCMASYAAYKRVWYSFSIPCLLPLMIMLALSSDAKHNMLSLLILVFFVFISRFMHKINETILTSLMLRLDKKDLSKYLEQEQERVYELNSKLQIDLEERKRTEEELRRAKAEAEKLAAELLTLSSLDSLTGISNRRSFDKFLSEEWNRATRQGRPISLIMCDIDYYKSYNDMYGHQAGDECLIRIAELLKTFSRRGGEMAARYGGEEFAIVLTDTSLHSAEILAEQMRQAIIDLKIPHAGSQAASCITLSFGVSSVVPIKNMPESRLISTADNALYDAKAAGRNCVVARQVIPGDVREKETVYQTLQHIDSLRGKNPNDSPVSVMEKVQLKRWDQEISVSETVLRKMLKSRGYSCARYEYPPGTVFDEHSHADDKIDAVLKGCLRITTGSQQYDLHPGDYICVPRGVIHKAEVVGDETVISLDGVKVE